MASGNDARFGIGIETTYGTRVAPTRFMPLTSLEANFQPNRFQSNALGTGRWTANSIVTTLGGSGSLSGEVPTTGFGYLLNGLHSGSATPVQQGATAAYLQTHTLSTAVTRSYSIQQQTPPVNSATLVPIDFLGCKFGGITFSWEPGSVLTYEIPLIVRNADTAQALETYVAPSAWDLLSFRGGSMTIGGVLEANIVGGGNLSIGYSLRDDAYTLGSSGLMADPVETDKPTAGGSFTADFQDLTNYNRTLNNTSADVVLRFQGATIASTHEYALEVTIPDCNFTTGAPSVTGPGPVQQEVAFNNASSTGDPVVITYMSTDTTI